MLEVQKFLSQHTLQDLKEQLAINYRIVDDLVCLNYNQILSPMGNPIVQECRQLILSTIDYSVVSCTFHKFFNVSEGHVPQDFDWEDFRTSEKLDGSLIALYHWNNKWNISTRSVPGAETRVDDTGLTFRELVVRAISEMSGGLTFEQFSAHFDTNYCYALELLSPENQVVVEYKERALVLLAVRHRASMKEIDVQEWAEQNKYPFRVVQFYPSFTLDAVKETVQLRDPKEHEGYVLVDKNFNRVKIKSSAYVFMSSRRDSLGKSNKARIELIQNDAVDDVLSSLPEFVQEKILNLQRKLKTLVLAYDAYYQTVKDIEGDRDFALEVQHSGFATVCFALRKGKATDAWDFFRKTSPKRVLEYLEEDDVEEEIIVE